MRIASKYINIIFLTMSLFFSCMHAEKFVIDRQKIMDYPIPEVIARYCKDYDASEEDAKLLEQELKKWFILTSFCKNKKLGMYSSKVDDLWHTFLLFTVDYQKFCEECFGKFIHHVPE